MKNNLDIGTTATLRLHKVDVHNSSNSSCGKTPTTPTNNVSSKIKREQEQQPTTTTTIQLNSGSTNTTPITSPSLDNFYLKPPDDKGGGGGGGVVMTKTTTPHTTQVTRPTTITTTTTKVEIENPIFHPNDANVNSPPSSPCSTPSPKGKHVKYAKQVSCPESKTFGRTKLEPSSEKARIRRQASTLSTCSDKVMILGDVAIKETMILANTTTTTNNNINITQQQHTTTNKNNTVTVTATTTTTAATTSSSVSLNRKMNGSTPKTAIAITTLSPTSRLSLDMSNSTTVVTHLQNPTTNTKMKNQNKKFRFPPFGKKTLSPPLIEIETTSSPSPSLSSSSSQPAPHHTPKHPTTTTRCRPKFCTPFCSCSSAKRCNEDQLNKKDFVTIYDDSTESSAPYLYNSTKSKTTNTFTTQNTNSTNRKSTKYDKNFLMPPSPTDLHEYNVNTTATAATSSAHIWCNIQDNNHKYHRQQQVHVCM